MMALKAARAGTGKPKIAKCEGAYHGSYDFAEVSLDSVPESWGNADPNSVAYTAGTPRSVLEEVIIIPFNRVEESEKILSAHADELACVLIDPMPNRAGLIPATTEYLEMLRRFTSANDMLLIFDEVISFRLGHGGAQGEFGVSPDLTTLAYPAPSAISRACSAAACISSILNSSIHQKAFINLNRLEIFSLVSIL